MSILRHVFLEDPRTVWILLGIAEGMALAAWARGRAKWKTWMLVGLPIAGLLAGVLDWTVETDYEKVHRSVRTIGQAARSGDAERLIERISEAYRSDAFRKQDLADLVRWGLPQVRAKSSRPEVVLADGQATVRQAYRLRPQPQAVFRMDEQWMVWEGTFACDPDGEWRLQNVRIVEPFSYQPERYLPRKGRG